MTQVSKKIQIKEGLQVEPQELTEWHKKILAPPEGHTGFDLRVHIVDPKTGQLLKFQPYRRLVSHGEVVYFRRDESGIERRYSEQGVCLDALPQSAAEVKKPHGNARVS